LINYHFNELQQRSNITATVKMKQPKIKITDTNGKDWGYKKVMSMNWDNDGRLWVVNVDFMESGNSNEFSPFYNYTGEFTNVHGNLKGEIVFD
jgi:hypothetical protein